MTLRMPLQYGWHSLSLTHTHTHTSFQWLCDRLTHTDRSGQSLDLEFKLLLSLPSLSFGVDHRLVGLFQGFLLWVLTCVPGVFGIYCSVFTVRFRETYVTYLITRYREDFNSFELLIICIYFYCRECMKQTNKQIGTLALTLSSTDGAKIVLGTSLDSWLKLIHPSLWKAALLWFEDHFSLLFIFWSPHVNISHKWPTSG